MVAHVFWIVDGRVSPRDVYLDSAEADCESTRFRAGVVRVVYGRLGTEVRWMADTPCVGSVLAASELLKTLPGPVLLRYLLAGWVEERLPTPVMAEERLNVLLSNCDRMLQRKVLLKSLPTPQRATTPLLDKVFRSGVGDAELAVACTYDCSEEAFVVEKIGSKSVIGHVFGTSLASYPCLTWGAYAHEVAKSYAEALDGREVIYEQVLALMQLPDKVQRWVPYHRLIVPDAAGSASLRIYSERAPVDIQII